MERQYARRHPQLNLFPRSLEGGRTRKVLVHDGRVRKCNATLSFGEKLHRIITSMKIMYRLIVKVL
jgi:hypothetical protein